MENFVEHPASAIARIKRAIPVSYLPPLVYPLDTAIARRGARKNVNPMVLGIKTKRLYEEVEGEGDTGEAHSKKVVE